jgi:hypothetical protein
MRVAGGLDRAIREPLERNYRRPQVNLNRARVYQVHHKPLYFLIGEASSRYRRGAPSSA